MQHRPASLKSVLSHQISWYKVEHAVLNQVPGPILPPSSVSCVNIFFLYCTIWKLTIQYTAKLYENNLYGHYSIYICSASDTNTLYLNFVQYYFYSRHWRLRYNHLNEFYYKGYWSPFSVSIKSVNYYSINVKIHWIRLLNTLFPYLVSINQCKSTSLLIINQQNVL